MIGNKITLILIFIFSVTFSSLGQNIKYKDYKNDISTNNYRDKIETEKYSPLVAGVCNVFFPTIGYFYVGEPLRGACVLGNRLVPAGAIFYGLVMSIKGDSELVQFPGGANGLIFSGLLVGATIQIWSVFDVVKIAKVKNLAYSYNEASLMVKPDFFIVNQNDKNIPTYGLRLSFNF